jgi:hypothetical protein
MYLEVRGKLFLEKGPEMADSYNTTLYKDGN